MTFWKSVREYFDKPENWINFASHADSIWSRFGDKSGVQKKPGDLGQQPLVADHKDLVDEALATGSAPQLFIEMWSKQLRKLDAALSEADAFEQARTKANEVLMDIGTLSQDRQTVWYGAIGLRQRERVIAEVVTLRTQRGKEFDKLIEHKEYQAVIGAEILMTLAGMERLDRLAYLQSIPTDRTRREEKFKIFFERAGVVEEFLDEKFEDWADALEQHRFLWEQHLDQNAMRIPKVAVYVVVGIVAICFTIITIRLW